MEILFDIFTRKKRKVPKNYVQERIIGIISKKRLEKNDM